MQAGVTALELAVAAAIVAIILATGVPALRDYGLERRMRAAVSQLHSGLALARNAAISRGRHAVVCPTTSDDGCIGHASWHEGWLVFVDLNGDREWQPEDPVLGQSGEVQALSITSTSSRSRIRFHPGGTAPASNATITFCDERGAAHARQLRISASGRIRRTGAEEAPEIDCEP
jgi:type IV fimbrial biogenesis protein FimT